MNTSPKILIALFAIVAVLASCESNHFFKSEKKLKGDIIGVWNRIPLGSSDVDKDKWTFEDGTISIVTYRTNYDTLYDSGSYYQDSTQADGVDTLYMDKGTYTVDATVAAPFLKIEGLTLSSSEFYNSKWTIVQLDGQILEIATDYPNNAGVLQKEFLKQ